MKNNILPLLSIFILVNLSCTRGQVEYMNQWPQFRGPFSSGIVETSKLPDTWNRESGENIKWDIDIPGLGHSCPVIWDDKIFLTTAISGAGTNDLKIGLYGDIDEDSDESIHELKLYCIDKNSGEILWEQLSYKGVPRTKRHTKSSHANPTPATNGKYVVAFFGSNGLIYIHNAHGRYSPIFAIEPGAKGDITLDKDSTTNENIVWSIKRGGAYNPTNLIYGDYMYNMRMNSQLMCFNAKTGERIYTDKLPDTRGLTASGVASNGKLYYSTEQGNVFVVKAGPEFEIIAENSMNDPIMASPAISDNMLFFRTQHSLIAVGK